MRSMLMALAAALSTALLACEVAAADTVETDFEVFERGTVNGQDGWKSALPGNVPALPNGYDQEVVLNSGAPTVFGQQSLRMSNLYANGEFFYQTYSKPVLAPAGEDEANKEYIGQFSFIPKSPEFQRDLFLSVSPDPGDGSRMSWVGLEDTPAGVEVHVSDAPDVDGKFVDYNVALLKDRTVPHTIRFWIKVNPGVTTIGCKSPLTVIQLPVQRSPLVGASRRGRTTTAPLRSRHRRRTSIRRRASPACSSAPGSRGLRNSPRLAVTCSTM